MFLNLAHTQLDVFKLSKEFVQLCYQNTRILPNEEKFSMTQQIRRAALSVHLNLCEGCSRKSVIERKRFLEISRGSLVEVDTAFDICISLNYITAEILESLGKLIVRLFQVLSRMINKCNQITAP